MEQEVKKETIKMDPQLRRKAMVNSGVLAMQFAMVSFVSLKSGATFLGIIGLLATVGTINDTLTFYYANKEK